jgi:uncharacterized small protein (DUF1192 family)
MDAHRLKLRPDKPASASDDAALARARERIAALEAEIARLKADATKHATKPTDDTARQARPRALTRKTSPS